MTEINWLKLSGLMHQCVYNRININCPFNDFRKLDNIQQYKSLGKIDETLAIQMLASCNSCRIQSKPIVNKDLVISNPMQFRIVS